MIFNTDMLNHLTLASCGNLAKHWKIISNYQPKLSTKNGWHWWLILYQQSIINQAADLSLVLQNPAAAPLSTYPYDFMNILHLTLGQNVTMQCLIFSESFLIWNNRGNCFFSETLGLICHVQSTELSNLEKQHSRQIKFKLHLIVLL